MQTIHGEMRATENGEPEMWVNLGDVLRWMDTLPEHTGNRIAAAVSGEIRELLFEGVTTNATLVQTSG